MISVGVTLFGVAPWPAGTRPQPCARDWERVAWRAVWWPGVPVIAVVSVLIGWVLVEPEPAEPLPWSALFFGIPITLLWLRVLLRTGRALLGAAPVVGTVGVWRPRVVLSDAFVRAVDAPALAAAQLHEALHATHRDPLRIVLAQIITDLQWPWPSARRRFDQWRRALELARDEEARLAGADGADLAAAILAAAQLGEPRCAGATLFDGAVNLEDRVARLLNPLAIEQRSVSNRALLVVLAVPLLCVGTGIRFGETLVQTILRWL